MRNNTKYPTISTTSFMQITKKRLQSILIKPAGPDCNMACRYCFYLEKEALFPDQAVHRMNDQVLKETVRQMMEQGGQNVSFGWQGGEPTLMGLEFFEKVVKFQQCYGYSGQTVGNGLQTNGLLIDNEWCRFLSKYNFLVGLSLDGPEHVHDRYRIARGGQRTWQRVTDARDRMLDAGVEVNALIVVNDYSVKFPEEMYTYHKEHGLQHMQFIPCVETDPLDPAHAAPFSVSAEPLGTFLCQLFDLWMNDFKNDESTTFIRWFDSLFFTYVGLDPPECTLLPSCGVYVVVEHNGNVYSCDFFVEPQWKLGNVLEGNLIDMLNSEPQNHFGQLKAAYPQECLSCKWLRHCYSGCTKDRIRDPRDQGSNHFCKAFKMFFDHANEKLLTLAERWKKQQAAFTENKIGRNDPCPCGSGKKYKKCCGVNI